MLHYRDPKTTTIISISQFCTDEFTRFFPDVYPTFKVHKILHTSELNETVHKTTFNSKPVVLGNWKGFLKGEHIIPLLKQHTNQFIFQ
jgi:hypothetical protein